MVTTLDREADPVDTTIEVGAAVIEDGAGPPRDQAPGTEHEEAPSLRPVLASWLSSMAAALVVGGIFIGWGARLFDVAVATGGALLAVWVLRSRRPFLAHIAVPVLIGLVAVFSVLPGGSPAGLPRHVTDAIDAARLLRIPIPFDPGWRPLLTVILGLLGFGSAWVGAGLRRPLLGVLLPLPLVGLAAISQPTSVQVLAGVFAFLPVLAAFGVLFGAEGSRDSGGLGKQFELSRLVRGAAGMAALAAVLVVLGQSNFLFPKPVYDPNDRPQKPRSVPLSLERDRVLFTVRVPPGFTGPWRTNVLDVYENSSWKLPGLKGSRLGALGANGTISIDATQPATVDITITTGDLGTTAVLPTVPTAQRIMFPKGHPELKVDGRSGTLRVPVGRAPSGLTYTLRLAPYPTAQQLSAVVSLTTEPDLIRVPAPPSAVQRLLAQAPHGPWARLDYVRHQLLDHVSVKGAGVPQEITAARVVDLLDGSKTGTPFEIVAAQALLARWAGVPSRIGVGFNDVNNENGTLTVRPRNAAQWLEVHFDGYGWIPLLDVPPRAQADLENKSKNDERVLPSDEIAVQLYVPVELTNPRLLYERVRGLLVEALPFLSVLLVGFLLAPAGAKGLRRRRRERWADVLGPRARIAVAYAELRDAATDLSVGDPFATPLEYLDRTQEDGEHRELAWLVTRAMYGDLALEVDDEDARLAEEMSASLQSRIRVAQPLQVRAVAFLSRASITSPWSDEVPNVGIPSPLRSSRLGVERLMRDLRRRRWERRRMRRRGQVEEAHT